MATFSEILQKNKLVLVDFTATWCGPCKVLSPILSAVKEELSDQISIVKIDVDKNRALAAQFRVQGVPTLILYKDGEQVWRQSGVVEKPVLLELIASHLH